MSKKNEKSNLLSVQNYLDRENIDFLYLSSFDNFLSEYVPMEDSFRFFMTNFTGSVAEGLIPKQGRIKLYVDGRYHEQADKECDHKVIEVVKVPFGVTLFDAMKEDLNGNYTLGVLASRTPQGLREGLDFLSYKEVDEEKIFQDVGFCPKIFTGPLWEVPREFTGRTVKERAQEFLAEEEYAFINALDTLAWFSNLRGSHLPYQGTFRALGLASREKLYLFVEEGQLAHVQKFASEQREVHPLENMNSVLSSLARPKSVVWDGGACTIANYNMLKEVFGDVLNEDKLGFHSHWQAIKNPQEIKAFRDSFEKSDQAIYDSLVWLIEQTRAGKEITELQFRDKANEIYKSYGARTQSFKTIAGFGANGSIIHYSNPSPEKVYRAGENVLMDSGAIYTEGMATDCTRTIVPAGRPDPGQVKNYTLVLKGLLKLMMANFDVGTKGHQLDELARADLKEANLNYAHGTGHGVGVNVHEAGYSIRPESVVPMQENLVGSIEPGCYVPGVGGIRLENIAHVKKDQSSGKLGFDSFVHIGFWPDLIDRSLLASQELEFLDAYEDECEKRGRSFKSYAMN